jgi:rfaE bifunctional protein nucleotidyltransferase chain/domain
MNNLKTFQLETRDKKIVFTNGCFDILHRGHIAYLNEAKSLGDVLVIGLNSDSSVKDLKGETRPINGELDRKFVLENLKSVDYVFIFDEQTPLNLIKELTPDVLVKGGDWKIEQIVGSDYVLKNGGKVYSLNFVDGYSTTNIIEKISI